MIYFKFQIKRNQNGFTIMELLVSLGLISLIIGMAVGNAISLNRQYFTDIVRTRINGNLRGAMDIISMNIRQTGENVSSGFPAVILTNGSGNNSDMLTLRRSLVTDVLTLCTAVTAGATNLYISNAAVADSACMASNITASSNVFSQYRVDNGGTLRIYIYNKTTQTGEFLNYTAEGTSSGEYYLTTSNTAASYPVLTSYIYMLEEYKFQLDTAQHNLNVYVNGVTDAPQTVAFSVAVFDVSLGMKDGTTVTSFANSSTTDWKDIKKVKVNLTGQENYRGKTHSSSVASEYFPRNVMSYES